MNSGPLKVPAKQHRPGRTRLVKDVLRRGRWYVGDDANGQPQYAEFTDGDLEHIARRFSEHRAAGHVHPLSMGHVKPGHSDIDPQDVLCDIADCWAENGVLYLSCYCDAKLASELTNGTKQVSIGLWPNWRDGTGKVWPGWSMLHTAVVSHAVVPGQQPFIELGRGKPTRRVDPHPLEIAAAKSFLRTGVKVDVSKYLRGKQ